MGAFYFVIGVGALILLAYLFAALLWPEVF